MNQLNQKILIVEDDPAFSFTLRDTLENEGYKVSVAKDGKQALSIIEEQAPDLMITEIELHGMSGYDLCKTIRDQQHSFPIIILSSRNQEIDKVTGLSIGADDYMTKPFGVKELLARIEARLRRSIRYNESGRNVLYLGETELDLNDATVKKTNGKESLSTREVEILRFLSSYPNEPVTRKALLENVWRYKHSTSTRTVDVHVSKLRTKIENYPNDPKYLVTMHGVGYMLKLH